MKAGQKTQKANVGHKTSNTYLETIKRNASNGN
jgi:hypothetical protein